jgi:MoxR-like ATPase
MCKQIAEAMGLEFFFSNAVTQEYKITGFIDANGKYQETQFYKAFTEGGVFMLDEIDASIPEVLVLLNAAIANRYFEFPNGRVDAHPNFRVVAAGNTVGSGANDLYTGRLVLDSATLDRFVIIEFDYDRNIEMKLANGNEHLVNFIRGLRRFAKENGVRATFSYRCIITVVKLEKAGMELNDILAIAVFKGLDMDTTKTFKTDLTKDGNTGKYYYAMQKYQQSLVA